MRSLKESIMGSNSISVWDTIKDLVRNGKTDEDAKKLQKLWDDLGLSIKGCVWEGDEVLNCIDYIYKRCVLISGSLGKMDMTVSKPTFWKSKNKKLTEISRELIEKLESSGHVKIYKQTLNPTFFYAKFI